MARDEASTPVAISWQSWTSARAELQRDEVVELVAAVGRGGQAEPAAVVICRTACSNAAAGTWWPHGYGSGIRVYLMEA